MKRDLPRPLEYVEKIILERRPTVWVALSIGGCGILTRAVVGKHDEGFTEARRTGLAFAHRVIEAISFASSLNRVSTPQILVDTADAVIEDPEHMCLVGTTWQCLPEGVEICSVGTNSVLVFEGDLFREVITPPFSQGVGVESGSPSRRYEVWNDRHTCAWGNKGLLC